MAPGSVSSPETNKKVIQGTHEHTKLHDYSISISFGKGNGDTEHTDYSMNKICQASQIIQFSDAYPGSKAVRNKG